MLPQALADLKRCKLLELVFELTSPVTLLTQDVLVQLLLFLVWLVLLCRVVVEILDC